ncbi:MAG TPA: DUF269 domain-containing protein [Anaeromyxobacter sp.]
MQGMTAAGREGTFLELLVRALREAEDGAAILSDVELLAQLIAHPGAHASGAVDPEVFWRIEAFFRAVGAAIEMRTGIVCVPMLRMRREGFGTIVLVAGRLVAVSRWFEDAAAFRFESLDALAAAGERLVREGADAIAHHPEVARGET